MKTNSAFSMAVAMAAVAAIGLMLVFVAQPDAVQADAPAAPTDLSARNAWLILPTTPEEGITLSWTAPEGTVTGYRILRQRSGCDDALVVHVEDTGSDETTYTDRDVLGGVTYNYRVKAINSEDIGPQSDAVTFEYGGNFSAGSGEIGGPEAPIGLDAWNVTGGIQLKWQEQDGWRARAGQTGYRILRRSPGNCEAFQVHAENTGSKSAYWKDTDTVVGTRYEYRVVLFNRFGRGDQSPSIEATWSEPGRWGTLYSIFPGYTFERFLNSSGTMAVGRLELDDDPETVDYTWRGDVTRDSDGADTDSCEGDGLGENREVTEVNSRTTMFDFTFGGAGCRVGDYTITYVVHDRNGNEELSGTMSHEVIGVTIDGRAQVGETLSADVSTISDTDAFKGTTFTYQWYWYNRDDVSYTEIEGATSSTYTVVAGDVGKTIKVGAVFTDTLGQESGRESFTTAAVVPANRAATGTPTISGTAQVGQTLTASTSGISDTDGLTNASYTYQWIWSDGTTWPGFNDTPFHLVPAGGIANGDITGATGTTYAVTAADVDKAIKLRVDFTDDKGSVESLTSSATDVVPVEVSFAFSIEGTTVTCDYYNVIVVNRPYKECDDPISVEHAASEEIEVGLEIDRSVSSQLYKFSFHIHQMEDSVGDHHTVEANDLCLGPGLADSISMEVTPDDGTGNFAYTDEGTIFNMCPSGTYQLYVPWYRYNYEDEEYEHAGAFRRYFFINGDDKDDTSIEQVKFITASYPDTPVSHDEVQIEGTKQSTRLNRTLTTFALSIDGLVPDSDTETTDYVVRVRVIGDGGPDVAAIVGLGPRSVVPWCHVGNVGYSYLLKTVPENGRWAMDAHVLGNCLRGSWPDTLQVELFDGSDLANYIKGKDIALGALSNNAATGAPTISGTVEVGETLTADTSGITDADGLTNASYRYQWLSSTDTVIDGATSSTYTLSGYVAGETIKVRVTFTDDAGNEETLISDATETVTDAPDLLFTGIDVYPSSLDPGEIFRIVVWVQNQGYAQSEGTTLLWKSSTDATITSSDTSVGQIGVRPLRRPETSFEMTAQTASSTPGTYYYGACVDSIPGESDTTNNCSRSVTVTVNELDTNALATGAPTINGTAQVGQTLTADTSGISDADGLTNATYSYLWLADDTEIASATGSTYTLAADQQGKTIKVRVAFTDDAGNEETLTSAATEAVAAANAPATGTPTISGTAEVGETLTADTSGIADADGLTNASYGYQWLSSRDTEIDGATSSTYTLADSDAGETIKVRVAFTDDAGNEETLTSDATGTVAEALAPEFWEGDLTVGKGTRDDTVWLGYTPFGGAFGSISLPRSVVVGQHTYSVQLVLHTSIDVYLGMSRGLPEDFVLQVGDVEFDSEDASSEQLNEAFVYRWPNSALNWSEGDQVSVALWSDAMASALPENIPATGAPAISGVPTVGQTLTAVTNRIADSNGMNRAAFRYQWISTDGNEDFAIAGAADPTYTLAETDEGKTIHVKVGFTDFARHEEAVVSPAVGPVAPRPGSPATGAPMISGTAQAGQTLTADTSGISDTDGLDNAIFSYRWLSGSDTEIDGATSSTYTLQDSDSGKTIKVRVAFTDDAGNEERLTSTPTATVSPLPTPLTASVRDEPESHDGQNSFTFELRFSENLDGFSYKTLRDHAFSMTGGSVANARRLENSSNVRWEITVEPASDGDVSIVLPETTDCDDEGAICANDGRMLSPGVTLTVAGPGGQEQQAAQENSPATGAPTIIGTVRVGETLTASTSGIADADGLTNASYAYQWIGNDGTTDSDIQEATSNSYTLVSGDVDKTIKVKVSFTDDAENEETLTSAATAAVAAAVPGAPGDLTVSVNDTGKLDLSWDAPEDDGGSAVTGYRVQWKESSDSWDTPANVSETTVTGTSHTVSGLTDGAEYTFRVVAVNSAGDGTAAAEESGTPRETTAPSVTSASVDGTTLTVTFSEDLTESPVPATTTFKVTVGQDDRGVDSVAVVGNTVTLTLASAVTAGDQVAAGYTAPTEQAAAMLKDLNENPAESFSGQTATNNTAAYPPALTASSHDVPTSHDGQTEFTFELRFSANVTGLSYKTLRDHAFTVTGGEVVQARRLEAGKNVRWEISVRPDGNGPVTVVLPATTDCEASGAVCTGDGRKLSPGLEFEVPGLSAPEITSGSSFSVEEGATEVATLRATDGDTPAADLTWSVSGGADEAIFALTAAGVLSFAAAKDYETPDDADTDGVYEVTLQVSDGGRTDSADLTVTLTNVNEAPTANAGADQENVAQGDTVTLNGSGADPDAGEVFSFAWVQTSGATVTLSDTAAASPTFTAPTGQTSDVELIFTLRVTDDEGLFAEDSVTVTINGQLPPDSLTASAHGVPAAHDGSTTITFELHFSEEPADGFSYKTLRDHAFTVTGGEVVNARRLETGKNIRWEISVSPDGDGPVTIVLPETTDCDADGAVCTDDGRMLSNRLEITVPGP